MFLDGQAGQESVDVAFIQLTWVTAIVKLDVPANPVDVGILGTAAVVPDAENFDHAVVEPWGAGLSGNNPKGERRCWVVAVMAYVSRNPEIHPTLERPWDAKSISSNYKRLAPMRQDLCHPRNRSARVEPSSFLRAQDEPSGCRSRGRLARTGQDVLCTFSAIKKS